MHHRPCGTAAWGFHRRRDACGVGVLIAAMAVAAHASPPAPDAMHQEVLEAPEPDGRRPLSINPPTFRWPAFGASPYTVELSRAADLSDATRRPPVRDSFDRPARPLEPGRYWWRVTDAGGKGQPVVSFDLGAGVAKWPIPTWEEALSRVPTGRPRLLMRPEDLPRLRELARGSARPLIDRWASQVARRIGAPFPSDEVAATKSTEPDEAGVRMKRQHVAKDLATKVAGGMDRLCLLYLLTGEDRYRGEIRRRALAAAAVDPDGLTSFASSDFANETIVLALAWAYDTLYDDWSSEERDAIRKSLIDRLGQAFSVFIPREQEIYRAHDWQHVVKSMTLGALAIYHESAEARGWFAWSLKAHVAFYPWYGGADGGSAEGLGYFRGHNLRPSLEAAALFEAATGVSLLGNPWYRNTAYFLMYGCGLGDANSQFSDNARQHPIESADKSVVGLLAARFQDPYLAAYHHAIGKRGGSEGGGGAVEDEEQVDDLGDAVLSLLWQPAKLPAPARLTDLPKARLFPNVGVVFMRSALTDPANDIFFEMRSSPYGNYVHAHADQNAFNVTAFGERLFIDSGYYYTYGDEHHRGWAKTTQAHNSVLVGGTGQGHARGRGDLSSYGQLTDYEVGDGFVRVTGSCPRAYKEKELRRFDRHVLWLEPDTYLIADDLEAAEPQTFQWLLHAKDQMDVSGDVVAVKAGKAAGRLQLFSPRQLRFEQTDQFAVPVKLWRADGQDASRFPDQWHLTASTTEPAVRQRFVAVLQVYRAGEGGRLPTAAVKSDEGGVTVRLSDGRTGRIQWR